VRECDWQVHIFEGKNLKRVHSCLFMLDRPRVSSEYEKFSQLYRPMADTDLSEVS